MNKIQSLFNFDERITPRNKKKEFRFTLLYALCEPKQWEFIRMWVKSNRDGETAYKDELPWITYAAINFLNTNLPENAEIFEYGSGGSTLYYAKKAKQLISVEHDSKWYEPIKRELKRKNIKNCNYILKQPSKSNSQQEYFRSWREQGVSFKDYVMSISKYKDKKFDLVSVDGRSRITCVREAYAKVKPGGLILLDNSERKEYFDAFLYLRDKGCEQIDFFGLVGYETPLSQTTIWRIKK